MKGYNQGEMKPTVDDYQKPMNNYSQTDFMKTDMYIERHDKFEGKECSKVKSQDYKGRYS